MSYGELGVRWVGGWVGGLLYLKSMNGSSIKVTVIAPNPGISGIRGLSSTRICVGGWVG